MSPSPSNKPKKSSVRHTRAIQRDQTKRPNTAPPDALAWARQPFGAVLALDGATLDALSKKVGRLQQTPGNVLAGRRAALLDGSSLLPRKLGYEENSKAHDQTFWEGALAQMEAGGLLRFDLGFFH